MDSTYFVTFVQIAPIILVATKTDESYSRLQISRDESQVTRKLYIEIVGGSRVTLVCLMAFCPKILGGGGDLWIIVLLKNESSFSGGDMWGGGDTQPLQDG